MRLKVTDAAGLPVAASVEVSSRAARFRLAVRADREGSVALRHLPLGPYRVAVTYRGLVSDPLLIEIRSSVPVERRVVMDVAPIETAVVVSEDATLLDPGRTSAVGRIGPETLRDRPSAAPGRSLPELVNTQPGWLLEANGVLHPRGSEYQTQYVLDGVPLGENRSPAFAPELDAGEVQSMTILTAGYPAEYGRKLGGVIEVNTLHDMPAGFRGKASASGGSFDTAEGYLEGQYAWGRNTLSAGTEASRTSRYLDPPVEENYTNTGTSGGFSVRFERDIAAGDRVGLILRRGQSRFEVPDELVQWQAGQRQDRSSAETAGQFSWQHVFSPALAGDARLMIREVSASLWSNASATPVLAGQSRGFREAYVKTTLSGHTGRHDWKAGVDADFGSIREAFGYTITDPTAFDPATPPGFRFDGRGQDREQALFVQDAIRIGSLTVGAGLRWDHYRLLVDESAWSPRLGAAWYWPAADLVFRASWDRVFQTPAVENLLLAGSPQVESLDSAVLRLPVRPGRGDFYEAGVSRAFAGKLRLDANWYRRDMDNFADDDLLLNTGISFPIAFRRAEVRGAEARLEVPRWGPLSGFVSYSNMIGAGYLPVAGGLFLGDEALGALSASGRFAVTQDQRNTLRSRWRVQLSSRVWIAAGGDYGSGLPVEFTGNFDEALAQYGPRIVGRVDFERGRVRPSFSLDASAGVLAWHKEHRALRFQVDARNLTGRLNVINFAGLFSGTALGVPRSFALRLEAEF